MSERDRFIDEASRRLMTGDPLGELLEGPNSFYPDDHQLGMEVPDGGSNCSKCSFWKEGLCRNDGFIRWNGGSGKIPVAPDSYCCDLFETAKTAKVDQDLLKRLIEWAIPIIPYLVDAWPGRGANPSAEEEDRSGSLNKRTLDKLIFMDEEVRISTVNGEFVRKPKEKGGLGLLEFTMGGNAWGGPVLGYYKPISDDDEVTLHDLMALEDFVAVACHELSERYVMKNLGIEYGFAHDQYADPVEYAVRMVL